MRRNIIRTQLAIHLVLVVSYPLRRRELTVERKKSSSL